MNKNAQLLFREFTANDFLDVLPLIQQVSAFTPNPEDQKQILLSFLNAENSYSIVVLQLDQIIGFGSIILYHRVRGGKTAIIEDIVIKQKFRNLGIGKQLIEKLIIFAKKNGCYKIILEANEQSRAFYSAIGFNTGGPVMKLMLDK